MNIYDITPTLHCGHFIGVCGELTAGKSTTARAIQFLLTPFYEAKIISFGYDVKRIAKEFGWDGEKDEKGRKLLQLIGTEVGRGYDPDLWVKYAWNRIVDSFNIKTFQKNVAIFDDLRFENEAQWIKRMGGFIIKVTDNLPKNSEEINHESEKGIPDKYISFELIQDYDVMMLVKGTHTLLTTMGFKTLQMSKGWNELEG